MSQIPTLLPPMDGGEELRPSINAIAQNVRDNGQPFQRITSGEFSLALITTSGVIQGEYLLEQHNDLYLASKIVTVEQPQRQFPLLQRRIGTIPIERCEVEIKSELIIGERLIFHGLDRATKKLGADSFQLDVLGSGLFL